MDPLGFVIIALVLLVAATSLVVLPRRRSTSTIEAPPEQRAVPPETAPPETAAPSETAAPEAAPPEIVVPETVVPEAPPLEVPAPVEGRLVRLRARLARSQSAMGRGLLALLSRDAVDESVWEEIEDTLLLADVGAASTRALVDRLRARIRVDGARAHDDVRRLLREELIAALGPELNRSLRIGDVATRPAVILVVGVNGTGKTTTAGKLARVLVADGKTVVLGAADTFRAAAVDQLATWGERVGAATVRGDEGADPASVAFDAVRVGGESGADAVVIDTAGRLHTKTGLMDELGKVKRVVERRGPVAEVLLVLDATIGQNGLLQARVFAEVVDVTGIVVTKLDGTAKGGIILAVQRELGVPVKLVGLGEGPDDLAPFDPEAFVDALLG